MLFANSVTYNVAYPDDGTCHAYISEGTCLAPRSSFSGDSKCAWDAANDECSFNEPASQLKQVVFVAVIAAIMSTPIAVFADYVIMKYIAAGVKQRNAFEVEGRRSSDGRKSSGMTRRTRKTVSVSNLDSSKEITSVDVRPSNFVSQRRIGSDGMRDRKTSEICDDEQLTTSLQQDMNSLLTSLRAFRERLDITSRITFDGKNYFITFISFFNIC
jgi:hypothetical protein